MATLGKPLAAFSHCEKTHRFQESFPWCTPPPLGGGCLFARCGRIRHGIRRKGDSGSVRGACPLSSTPHVPSGTARTRYAQSRRGRKARRSGPHQSGFRREIGEAVYQQWPWTSSARLVHGRNRGAPSSSDDQGLLSTPQSEGQRVPSRDCPLPAQVTYDLKRAGEDEPRVAKQNDRLRFPQTLVATSLTHPRRGDPLRGCSLRCDPLRGCVPTEPRSVSPRTHKVTRRRGPNQSQPIEHPRHSSKNSSS